MRGDRVLVTGASGFVGSAVARALQARGAQVVCLVRQSSPRGNLEELHAELSYGDMRDQASVELAAKGARYLFHVAADYRIWARDPEEIVRANRDGTEAVMRAALACGVERIVYTSSVATLGPSPGADKDAPADETGALTPRTAVGVYKRSKVIAERLVERMIGEQGLPGVETDTWYGVIAPARVPAAIVNKINADVNQVLKSRAAQAQLEQEGAEFHHIAGQLAGVDDIGSGEFILKVQKAAFNEALLFARGMVFGVLRQVAVAARLGDGADHRRTIDRFQALDLLLKVVIPVRGHRNLVHQTVSAASSRIGDHR